MTYSRGRALELLRAGTGDPAAEFRKGQEPAISSLLEGRQRLLVVQRTGWGKSIVYFIATKLIRENGGGPTLLVSPLLSLMRNQVAAAKRMGVCAVTINSDNVDDWARIEEQVVGGEVDILLISPERLSNDRFQTQVLAKVTDDIGLLVIDEAHCISDWGHDFRPHYRLLERITRTLPPSVRLLATTATANNRVMEDLTNVLGPNLDVLRGDLNRPSLSLQTIRLQSQAERMAWLAEQVVGMPGHGIIYTLTVRDAERLTDWLQFRGLDVECYTGQTGERRAEIEQLLLENRVKALVATVALGMGYDKPDLGFVIHYQSPGSVVAYYQQVGRAGRALESAYGVLLSGAEDTDINDYFIEGAFPTPAEVTKVLEALEEHEDGLSIPQLMEHINLSKGRLQKTIDLLALESPAPIVKVGSKWQLTAAELGTGFWERAERLTELRRVEQAQMQEYVHLSEGHMEFLIRALDGETTGIGPPRLPRLPTGADPKLVRTAEEYLRRTNVPIEPRKQWPTGGLPIYRVSGSIPAGFRAEEGRALCIWGDAGWGGLVRAGKYQDGRFADELVNACVDLLQEWHPDPAPTWVTCIPSQRHPELVPDFAARLAVALSLPFAQVLRKVDARPEQKEMANSTQQARNLDGSLEVVPEYLQDGPVLLVDDMVDSKWTITVAAWLLRTSGADEVWPLALAVTSGGK